MLFEPRRLDYMLGPRPEVTANAADEDRVESSSTDDRFVRRDVIIESAYLWLEDVNPI